MDGTFAAAFLVASLLDMNLNHCGVGGGCLAPEVETSRLAISAGDVILDEVSIANELYLRYDAGKTYGPFQPIFGASFTDQGSVWAGAGTAWTSKWDQAYLQLHLMGGLYSQGGGADIGSLVEFRSGVEIGYEFDSGTRIGLSYDHRSNAEIDPVNPGLETLQLRVSIPLK